MPDYPILQDSHIVNRKIAAIQSQSRLLQICPADKSAPQFHSTNYPPFEIYNHLFKKARTLLYFRFGIRKIKFFHPFVYTSYAVEIRRIELLKFNCVTPELIRNSSFIKSEKEAYSGILLFPNIRLSAKLRLT